MGNWRKKWKKHKDKWELILQHEDNTLMELRDYGYDKKEIVARMETRIEQLSKVKL